MQDLMRSARLLASDLASTILFLVVLLITKDILLAVALGIAAVANLWELRAQENPASLQTPLRSVGLRALTLSLIYSSLVIAGLW